MYCYDYPRPAVAADCVILQENENGNLHLLLIKRGKEPYKEHWALPGGFVEPEESCEEAARREVEEETGLKVDAIHQLGTYSTVNRDPRTRVISVVYIARLPESHSGKAQAASDASEAQWFPVNNLPDLAFDHDQIIQDALK